jgi:hypothetical protein
MRINMRESKVRALADQLYQGASRPISKLRSPEREVQDEAWWRSGEKPEGAGSDRHLGALRLYVKIGRRSTLNDGDFPARFDFDDGSFRPDKGAIKAFLNNGLITSRKHDGELVFTLTKSGRSRLVQTNPWGADPAASWRAGG